MGARRALALHERHEFSTIVMPGLDPGIHSVTPLTIATVTAWMVGAVAPSHPPPHPEVRGAHRAEPRRIGWQAPHSPFSWSPRGSRLAPLAPHPEGCCDPSRDSAGAPHLRHNPQRAPAPSEINAAQSAGSTSAAIASLRSGNSVRALRRCRGVGGEGGSCGRGNPHQNEGHLRFPGTGEPIENQLWPVIGVCAFFKIFSRHCLRCVDVSVVSRFVASLLTSFRMPSLMLLLQNHTGPIQSESRTPIGS